MENDRSGNGRSGFLCLRDRGRSGLGGSGELSATLSADALNAEQVTLQPLRRIQFH
jgi:hypothetical protein